MAEASIRLATEADIEPAYAVLEACNLGPWFELTAEQFGGSWWSSYEGIWVVEEDGIVGYSTARGESVEVYVLLE